MTREEPDPLRGPADLARRIENGEDPNKDLEAHEAVTKAEGALFLSLAGASWTEIARQQGYVSPTRARLAVERILAEAVGPEEREQMRMLQDRRYKRLLQSVMGKAVNPKEKDHLAYNARALAIVDRISVLHGLNAPQQVQITPTDQYLRDYLDRMLPEAQKDRDSGEADILSEEEYLDATIVEDEK